MTPVEPLPHAGAKIVTFAKNQPQYHPLPASIDDKGIVMTEWEPSAEELDKLLSGGRVRLWVYTFNNPLQPVMVEVAEPDCGMRAS